MSIQWVADTRKLEELTPAKYNPRKISDEAKKQLNQSLTKFDVADPIIINTDNKIIGGHQRYYILKEKGVTDIDVRVPSRKLTPEEEKELNLRLNRNTGEWNFEALANFDEEMLVDVGFSVDELEEIFKADLEPDEKDDVVPEVRETDIKLGDMFKLGEHRLLCGDATKKEDVEKLMQGEKADMVFTDPPYGVSYADKNKFLNNQDKGNHIQTNIENDHKSVEEMSVLWGKVFSLISEIVLKDVSSYYICSPQGGELYLMMMMMNENGMPLRHNIIWAKNNHVLGRTDYNYKHEPIIYGWHKRHKFYGYGDQKFSLWNYNKPHSSKLHPTMKPVELIVNAILNSTERNMEVCDIFGGSGSTLIACEKTNRKCRMMEIDPVYCQVIIDRWEEYTGNKAEKV